MTEECVELKNIKYKTMLLSPNTIDVKTKENVLNLDEIIKQDKLSTENLPWNKLNKTMKIKKINDYITHYSKSNQISGEVTSELKTLLHSSIDNKMLQRAKDIVYDKNAGIIKNIPGLSFNKSSKKFTIRNTEKKTSPLRSLAPKNKKRTVKNKSDKNKNSKNDKGQKTEKTK
jgi:hypothetical protein